MKLTPLDIQQQQFRSSLFGFDPKEVDAFLDVVANELEGVTRDNHSLRKDLNRLESVVQTHIERERTLKDTMMTATRVTEDIKDNARKESEIVIAEARNQAEQIIQNAHTRLVRILEDIDELRRQKAQFEAGLRSTLEGHRKLLDAMAEGDANMSEIKRVAWIRGRESGLDEDLLEEDENILAFRDGQRPAPDEGLLVPRGGDR